jgi:hypothetical protein
MAVAFAVAAIAAAPAHADEPAVVPVEIRATQPGSSIQVRGRGREFACGEHCVLQLPQHDYRVIVRDRDGNDYATALTIMAPTRLTASPGNHGAKMLGIGLFAGGVAATVVALSVFYVAWRADVHTCTADCDAPMWQWYASGVSLAAGAGLGATGIIVWKASAHARVAASPLALTASF